MEIRQDKIFLLMEFAAGGSVGTRIRLEGALNEIDSAEYIGQALLGLVHLHGRGIIHRDVKCDNLLIGGRGQLLLADFGASKQLRKLHTLGEENLTTIGSPYWMAPEVIQSNGYGRKADVWSLGCSLIEMLSGRPPWSHFDNHLTAIWHIALGKSQPVIPAGLSEQCYSFIDACLVRDKEMRQSSSELLRHSWLQGVSDIRSLSPYEDTRSLAPTPETLMTESRSMTASPDVSRLSDSSECDSEGEASLSPWVNSISDTSASTLFGTLSTSTAASFVSKNAVLLPPPT